MSARRDSVPTAYPIKPTGLTVNMTRQALNLAEMTPVKTVVQLKDLSAYGER